MQIQYSGAVWVVAEHRNTGVGSSENNNPTLIASIGDPKSPHILTCPMGMGHKHIYITHGSPKHRYFIICIRFTYDLSLISSSKPSTYIYSIPGLVRDQLTAT